MQNGQQAAYKTADNLIGHGDIELAEVLLVHKPIVWTKAAGTQSRRASENLPETELLCRKGACDEKHI